MLESNKNPVEKVQLIVSVEGGVLVITDKEEINMDEGETSLQDGGSCRQIATAAILQQI